MAPGKSQKLEDQAATAALYVTKGRDNKSSTKPSPSPYPLDDQGKLSSAGAAASLKHADAQDLPAFPVVGLSNPESSAGAAASLANQNQKKFEYWKPGEIPAANKAAMLAKDYKAPPLWHSELSAASSKAALLADKEGGDVKIWRPEATDAGNSAAGQAMRMKGLSPQLDYGHTEDGGRRAMMAATQSMASSRKRAGSTPVVPPSAYPDSKNSAANALKAATSVSRAGRGTPTPAVSTGSGLDGAKIHNAAVTNLSREMYTSHPPVAPEIEEKKRQDTLRASAVAMAQQMYKVQQRAIEEAQNDQSKADSRYGATHAHGRPASVMSEEHPPPQYANLQEAAQKLAAERLAKLHDEHAAYRNYYGTEPAAQSHKLSIRGRPRRRASSDGAVAEDDEARSRQIRSEMSLFTAKIDQVDNKKRQKDRDSLLAAAQRNVRASMHAQDERVFSETGKVSPAMMAEWEAKAKAKADADSSARMVNHGKVNIGGGRYMDQSEIDAIALAKVQPTLDEVTVVAEKHRARDEEIRQQQLERERLTAEKTQDQKTRDAQTKAEWKRFKEKREARARKEEERNRKIEEKRLRDEEKRKSKEKTVSKKEEVVAGPVETEAVVTEPAAAEAVKVENVASEEEPPVLEPIPHVATPMVTEERKLETLPVEEERIPPTFIPMSERDEVTMSQANLAPPSIEESESDLAPAVTAESNIGSVGALSSDPESIAQRVFSAPVQNEAHAGPGWEPTEAAIQGSTAAEVQQAANTTEDITEAPVVRAEITSLPATETIPITHAEPATTAPKPSSTVRHDAPVTARVAPAITPAATTETTVSGPASPKGKDSKGVSSWLKTKFSRRASKPIKPESTTDSKEKGFVGGVNLTGPEGSNTTSSDHGDSSMREVAMAGKETAHTPAANTDPAIVSPTTDDGLYDASPKATGALRRSTSSPSISSLSSDEDTRGRSAVPREKEPLTAKEFVRSEIKEGEHVDPTLAGPHVAADAPNVDPALISAHGKDPSSSAGGGEEFEEARDTFDSEKLSPPAAGFAVGERKSDSPARDSKFLEDL
ncbi:hypothetical protein P7C71_g104, partial [Lecanoromycetidae sp. Uapishka_2]